MKNRKSGMVPVLVFHKIIPEYDPIWPGIHPKLFEEIIIFLKKHYRILPLGKLKTSSAKDLKDACFITFDDGYKDYLDYAYPILKRQNVHSTIFVLPPDYSNQGHIWTSVIIFFVRHYSFIEINNFLRENNCNVELSEDLNDFHLNLKITKYLCGFTHKVRNVIIEKLLKKFRSDNRIIQHELLTMQELQSLDSSWCAIESHSLTHPGFKLETDESFIEHEVKESKVLLENTINIKVTSFAFPFAQTSAPALAMVKKYYTMCFSKINEPVNLEKFKTDKEYLFDLPRYNVHHSSAEEVFFLINGFHKRLKG
ncbi:MAG: polysaccharide deacetylase family protein [Bacteroidetes bacterium]|nr:polysaccharide deacetylase family protein [Bacteroidota bacterium]